MKEVADSKFKRHFKLWKSGSLGHVGTWGNQRWEQSWWKLLGRLTERRLSTLSKISKMSKNPLNPLNLSQLGKIGIRNVTQGLFGRPFGSESVSRTHAVASDIMF